MRPEGTCTISYRVDLGEGEALIATTHDVGDPGYEQMRGLLDAPGVGARRDMLDATMAQLETER